MPTAVRFIDPSIVKDYNAMLDRGEYVADEIIDMWGAYYPDGTEVDVKLVGHGDPYVDVVWFRNGCEVAVCEPSYQLDGAYHAYIDGVEYVLLVEEDWE